MKNFLILLCSLLIFSCANSNQVTLQTITITPTPISTPLGVTLQLTATGTYSDQTTKNLTESVAWGSSNVGVATISSKGLLTPVAIGQATVSATYNSVVGNATATITSATLKSIVISPSVESIISQSTVQYTATGTYSDNSTKDITTIVNWNSSNESIATINSQGLASTIGLGTTNFTASLESISASTALLVNYYLYVTNTTASNTVSVCPVNPNNYSLGSNCTTALGGLNNPQAITVYNGNVYIVNYGGNNVFKCPINPNNGLLGACTTLGNGLVGPTGISFYNGYVYISNNNNNTISYCPVVSGQFGTCTTTGSSVPNNPNGIFVYNGYAYIASLIFSNIYYCPVQSNGTLGVCAQANAAPFASSTSATFIKNGYAYISVYGNNSFASCPVNANGSFGACNVIGLTLPTNGYNLFITPYGYTYFAAAFASTVYYCPVNLSVGTFGTCIATGNVPSALVVGGM